jgi:hypothetical protein
MMLDPIEFRAGSSDEIVIPLTGDGGAAIVDFTGWTAKAQLMFAPGAAVLSEWDTADGTIRLEDSSAVLEAPPEATSLAWTFRFAWFDLRTVDPDDKPSRPYRGGFEVVPAFTTA